MINFMFQSLLGVLLFTALMIVLLGCEWVLKILLDELFDDSTFERLIGWAKEKSWKHCSKEEKEEVEQIINRQNELRELYKTGMISQRKYRYNLTLLERKVDEIERKYV